MHIEGPQLMLPSNASNSLDVHDLVVAILRSDAALDLCQPVRLYMYRNT